MDSNKQLKKFREKIKVIDVMNFKGIQKPTWVELFNKCNRKCVFCPKSNEDVAPDTYQMMNRAIIDKIQDQLRMN